MSVHFFQFLIIFKKTFFLQRLANLVDSPRLKAVRASHADSIADCHKKENECKNENIRIETRAESNHRAKTRSNRGMARRHASRPPEQKLEQILEAMNFSKEKLDCGFYELGRKPAENAAQEKLASQKCLNPT